MPMYELSLRPDGRGWAEHVMALNAEFRSAAGFLNSSVLLENRMKLMVLLLTLALIPAACTSKSGGEAMIPGLGDQASFAMYALTVRKGDAAFMIRLNLPTRLSRAMRQGGGKGAQQYADDLLAMDKALATKALTRL